ncbi:GGDEF domain-containing protein [Pleionea sediminis]|uniref:GGDEF domain-containing protein n=1 Tax=Pleionea sediminis TaxID=2569479 RepID=UPI001186F627|nr:diguanylate cyclase [Pleionea sediminis]
MLEILPYILLGLSFILNIILFVQYYWQKKELAIAKQTDKTTGLNNTQATFAELEQAFLYAKRYHRPLTIALLHIGGLSELEDDSTGARDKRLKKIAKELNALLRNTDILGRVDNQQFLIALTHTNTHDARAVFERISEVLTKAFSDSFFNLGVVHVSSIITSSKELMSEAQMALRDSKANGANQIAYSSHKHTD